MTEPVKCPNCGLGADGDGIEKKFGYRISNNKRIVQSWCKLCRSGKEIVEEETPVIDKKVQAQLRQFAESLTDKESVIELFTNPKGLDFHYDGEHISTDGWSKDALRIVKEFNIDPIRIAEHEGLDVIYFEISSDEETKWKKVATEILVKHGAGFSIVISHKPNSPKWIFSGSPQADVRHAKHLPIEIGDDVEISSSFVDWLAKIRKMDDDTLERVKLRVNSAFDEFATEIECALGDNVFAALQSLLEGVIFEKSNGLKFDNDTLLDVLNPLFTLLYRIMFVLYAESRGVFDTDNKIYYEKFSMKKIVSDFILEWEREPTSLKLSDDFVFWKRLQRLFQLIEKGSRSLNIESGELEMKAYGGSLFDSDLHPKLEKWKFNNKSLLETIKQLVRVQEGKNRSFVNYASIEVRHIGTVYEKLLEFHPEKENGKIMIFNKKGKKESEGTYYTPKYIVDNIVENALGPIVDKIIKENSSKNDQIEKILSLKILDPAMGSGHFLVEAANYLGSRIQKIGSEKEFVEIKREIVRRCLYGVDINPLSVELAKMSLWLDTLAKDHALSFLATHLKNGDSIVGATREEMESGKFSTKVGGKKITHDDGQTTLGFEDYSKTKFREFVKKYTAFETWSDDDASVVKGKINDEMKTRGRDTDYDKLKYLLDIQVSQFYGKEIPYRLDLRAKIGGKNFPNSTDKDWEVVRKIAKEKKFFHWDLEFPQIFCDEKGNQLENPGFDVILGNPPYGADGYDNDFYEKFELQSKESYGFFMVRPIDLLKKGGIFSLVVNDTWRNLRTKKDLREKILKIFTIKRLIKLSRYAFKSPCPTKNIDAFTIIFEFVKKSAEKDSAYYYYDLGFMLHPVTNSQFFNSLLKHAGYNYENKDWEFDPKITKRYLTKQKPIEKVDHLPIYEGDSTFLNLFLEDKEEHLTL